MDRRERSTSEEEVMRLAFRGMQSRIWTALPGIVDRFDAARMTVDVQPAINARSRSEFGEITSLRLPKLLDCPVLWQGGGGVTLTFPIALGDECLVIFSARCIDAWWANGGIQDPPDIRMHNLSDGFVLVGVRSLPRAFTPSSSEAILRSDDGSTFISLNPTGQLVQITAPGGINLNGVMIDSAGNVSSPATVTAATDVLGNGTSLHNHTHRNTQPGSGNSGTPN